MLSSFGGSRAFFRGLGLGRGLLKSISFGFNGLLGYVLLKKDFRPQVFWGSWAAL